MIVQKDAPVFGGDGHGRSVLTFHLGKTASLQCRSTRLQVNNNALKILVAKSK